MVVAQPTRKSLVDEGLVQDAVSSQTICMVKQKCAKQRKQNNEQHKTCVGVVSSKEPSVVFVPGQEVQYALSHQLQAAKQAAEDAVRQQFGEAMQGQQAEMQARALGSENGVPRSGCGCQNKPTKGPRGTAGFSLWLKCAVPLAYPQKGFRAHRRTLVAQD